MDLKQSSDQYIAQTYKRNDVLFIEGNGSNVKDEMGKEYIDFGSGIAVNTLGIADTKWADAVCEQVRTLQHMSNLYYTEPQSKLAQQLCARSGMRNVFFSNSGAEANECMIKAARKYASDRYGDKRQTMITLRNSFHGRTVTTLSATGQDAFHKQFGPFTPGFVYAEPDDIEELQKLVAAHNPGAIMIELIQGEGGVHVLDRGYVQTLAKLCAEKDILLLIDEVQTGNGRTGTLYAYMQYGIEPDIFSTAKGLAGGLPLGATLFGSKTKDVLGPGDHGSTFGGNPVCAAGALAVLEQLDETLLAEVRQKSQYTIAALSCAKGVKSVTGMGLMLGIEPEHPAADVVADCLQAGLVVLTAKTKVRLLPALTIPQEVLEQGIAILLDALAK